VGPSQADMPFPMMGVGPLQGGIVEPTQAVLITAAAAAAAGRWPALTVSAWELAAVVTMGSLLSPAVAFRPVRGGMLPSALG
jgi:hypothetical protein